MASKKEIGDWSDSAVGEWTGAKDYANGASAGSVVLDPLDLFGNRASQKAAEEQYAAQQAAYRQQQQNISDTRNQLNSMYAQGMGGLGWNNAQAQTTLGYHGRQGIDTMQQGYGQAAGQLQGLTGLQSYAPGAAQTINSYDVVGQRQNRLGQMMDSPGGLYAGFQADPGYRFRLQQGEQAINRAASAQGGRNSGRTLKALSDYNQDAAAQEYGNFASRRQAEAGMAGAADQADFAALANQAGRTDQAQLAAQQNQMALAGMGYGAQQGLANLYAQQGNAVGGAQAQLGQNAANLYADQGRTEAGLATSMGGNYVGLTQQANDAAGQNAQYAGMTSQAQANNNRDMLNTAAGIFTMFSDRRLKDAIEPVSGSPYAALGLQGVRWRWNDQAMVFGLAGDGVGVIAQDVAKIYPDAVSVGDGGYLKVDYHALDAMLGAID